MATHKILVTGDFWHTDFQKVVSKFDVPVTLVPFDKVETVVDQRYDLVVLAQSRRDQFLPAEVEELIANFPSVPVVGLLGSWCEGETRSGRPYPGVTRVYWHQWEGRYSQFVEQLEKTGITNWHAPRTSTPSDRIVAQRIRQDVSIGSGYIGVSAWTRAEYEMLDDAITSFGWRSRWVERSIWDAASSATVLVMCVVADSWTGELEKRIEWLNSEIPDVPFVLLLNYPRQSDIELIEAAGVTSVVSKPFELQDLKVAISKAAGEELQRLKA
ncbi:MAG: hypothetical protein ACR2NK_06780 [Mariniblastus sp.]